MPLDQLQAPATQSEENKSGGGGMSLGAASFNLSTTKEFIPKGKMVNTADEFPDMDALLDEGPKNKKSKKGKKKGKV